MCVCVSQKCGSAAQLHFMGKSVSHHCVLSGCQTLTGLVDGCVCGGVLSVRNRRCWLQREAQEKAELGSCWRLSGDGRQQFKTLECRGASLNWCVFDPLLVECCLPALDFERGDSRCGLASGASGCGELQGCVPWAVSSPCQRTGEMLLRGQ